MVVIVTIRWQLGIYAPRKEVASPFLSDEVKGSGPNGIRCNSATGSGFEFPNLSKVISMNRATDTTRAKML
jgi:hypothetical protein